MNSYQKLKAKIKAKDDEIKKLLTDPQYYITQSMAYKIALEAHRRSMFGGKPTGTVKGFDGLIQKIIKQC